jgi:hypothetical protein
MSTFFPSKSSCSEGTPLIPEMVMSLTFIMHHFVEELVEPDLGEFIHIGHELFQSFDVLGRDAPFRSQYPKELALYLLDDAHFIHLFYGTEFTIR